MLAENRDDVFPVAKARDFIPGRPHVATITRWRLQGVIGPDGQRIRLRTCKVGGRVMVTLAAIHEFLAACNAPDDDEPSESDSDRQRRSQEARKALRGLGV